MPTILKSKIRPPTLRGVLLERGPALLRLDAAGADPQRRLILLTAAPGYSKTILLADWVRQAARRGVPVAWYSLGPGDRALRVFVAYLKAALQAAVPGFGNSYAVLVADAPNAIDGPLDDAVGVEEVLAPLLAALEQVVHSSPYSSADPCLILVLDDVHHVSGDPALDLALAFLVGHLPPGMLLALSTRRDLGRALPLARLRQGGQVADVQEGDLRFLPSEIGRAYPALDAAARHSTTLAELVRDLDGWPAGLALLHERLIEGGAADGDDPVVRRVHEDLQAYFAEEVLGEVREPLYSFLLRVAVLDEMTVAACDALTGLTGSTVLLNSALQQHLFIGRGSGEPPVYRYHPLFRATLLTRLVQMYGASERRRLYRAAAAYYAGEQAWGTVAHYFLLAGDLDAVLLAVEMAREQPGLAGTTGAALGAALRDVGDPALRRRLVETLGGPDQPGDEGLLAALLLDQDEGVREAALAAQQGRPAGLLRIQMFGGLRLWRGDTPVEATAWRRRRARLLLIYLLLAGPEGATRAAIAEKVWPDARPAEAGAQFYAHLRTLREVLEPDLAQGAPSRLILSQNGRYAFNFAAPHSWDLAEFQQQREAGRRAERLGQTAQSHAAYHAALACYTGDLLPERDLQDIPWLLPLRATCVDDAQAMRRALAEAAAAAGDWDAAIPQWQAILASAPTDEEIHVRLMTVYAWRGHHKAALAQYTTLRAALRTADGSSPAPATTARYEQILHNAPATVPATPEP